QSLRSRGSSFFGDLELASSAPDFRRAKEHVMGAAELQLSKIERKFRLKFLAIPGIGAKELFIVLAAFIPMREQRTCKVQAFPVPTLRNHVYLAANLFLIHLAGVMRVRDIENAAFAISEAIHKQRFVVRADADVHGQHTSFGIADSRHIL